MNRAPEQSNRHSNQRKSDHRNSASEIKIAKITLEKFCISNQNIDKLIKMMVGSKPRFPKKSCALYAGN